MNNLIKKKTKFLMMTLSLFTVLAFAFGNCSEVSFDNASDESVLGQNALKPYITIVRQPSNHLITQESILEYILNDPAGLLTDSNCEIDGTNIPCKLKGDTLVWAPGDLSVGKHEVEIIVSNNDGLKVSAKVDWTIFEDFVKKDLIHKVEIENVDKNKIDLLFVVDNSGSMKQEQANMAERIYNVLDEVEALDWRVAVTSTDPNNNGKLLKFSNSAYYLNKGDAKDLETAKDMLSNLVQLGTKGSKHEQGILATYKSVVNRDDFSFYRDNVGLSVILISDEDESGSAKMNMPDELIKLITTTWPQKPFFFNSIIYSSGQNKNTCSTGLTKGLKYEELTKKTGGILGSVCSADYAKELKDIGSLAAKVIKTVALDCVPQDIDGDNKPDVTVTGQNVPSYTVNGVNVIFVTELLPGDYKFEYWCPAIP